MPPGRFAEEMAASHGLQVALVFLLIRIDHNGNGFYPLVMVSSKFNSTLATTVQAASLSTLTPSGGLPKSPVANFSAAVESCLNCDSSCS